MALKDRLRRLERGDNRPECGWLDVEWEVTLAADEASHEEPDEPDRSSCRVCGRSHMVTVRWGDER